MSFKIQEGIMAEQKPEKKEVKTKRPSALKTDMHNEKSRLRNRACRSTVQTAIRSLEESLKKKGEGETVRTSLEKVYSVIDKAVKKGVFKPQKGARTKSRLSLRCQKA